MTTNLWTVGQGIVTRRLVPKPAPAAEAVVADAAEGRPPATAMVATADAAAPARPRAPKPAPARRAA